MNTPALTSSVQVRANTPGEAAGNSVAARSAAASNSPDVWAFGSSDIRYENGVPRPATQDELDAETGSSPAAMLKVLGVGADLLRFNANGYYQDDVDHIVALQSQLDKTPEEIAEEVNAATVALRNKMREDIKNGVFTVDDAGNVYFDDKEEGSTPTHIPRESVGFEMNALLIESTTNKISELDALSSQLVKLGEWKLANTDEDVIGVLYSSETISHDVEIAREQGTLGTFSTGLLGNNETEKRVQNYSYYGEGSTTVVPEGEWNEHDVKGGRKNQNTVNGLKKTEETYNASDNKPSQKSIDTYSEEHFQEIIEKIAGPSPHDPDINYGEIVMNYLQEEYERLLDGTGLSTQKLLSGTGTERVSREGPVYGDEYDLNATGIDNGPFKFNEIEYYRVTKVITRQDEQTLSSSTLESVTTQVRSRVSTLSTLSEQIATDFKVDNARFNNIVEAMNNYNKTVMDTLRRFSII